MDTNSLTSRYSATQPEMQDLRGTHSPTITFLDDVLNVDYAKLECRVLLSAADRMMFAQMFTTPLRREDLWPVPEFKMVKRNPPRKPWLRGDVWCQEYAAPGRRSHSQRHKAKAARQARKKNRH